MLLFCPQLIVQIIKTHNTEYLDTLDLQSQVNYSLFLSKNLSLNFSKAVIFYGKYILTGWVYNKYFVQISAASFPKKEPSDFKPENAR